MADTDRLSAYLWDLRAHAESKLRCVSRAQQQLARLCDQKRAREFAAVRREIVTDLQEILTITRTLQSVAEEALETAMKLAD